MMTQKQTMIFLDHGLFYLLTLIMHLCEIVNYFG
jgi:hypothetical protein